MARLLRTELPDGFFHVTARGVDETFIYRDDDDRRSFLGLLARAVPRFDWVVHAFCLMGTHYHLVVESTQPALSRGVQWLNGVHGRRFNRRHDRRGHLFGGRFAAWVIEDEPHLENTCAYVLENPVRAGLCAHPDEWPWSGVRGGRNAP